MQSDNNQNIAPRRAIRLPRVREMTGASSSTVWRWAKNDPEFPKPFRVGRALTCWDECEVLRWIEGKKAARGGR
jgi:predicted DNA-binding transcriptional regulator AlpA